jgi:hypothetical protein
MESESDFFSCSDTWERLSDDVGVSVAYPLPGTKFHDEVRRQLGKQKNWRESNDLSMMFAGTYRSEFYRTVRDILHEQIEVGMTPQVADAWRRLEDTESEFRQAQRAGASHRVAAFPAS